MKIEVQGLDELGRKLSIDVDAMAKRAVYAATLELQNAVVAKNPAGS